MDQEQLTTAVLRVVSKCWLLPSTRGGCEGRIRMIAGPCGADFLDVGGIAGTGRVW